MEEKIFSAGAQIIKQGDDGDYLFVIEDVRDLIQYLLVRVYGE
jgi:hypothetical protein